MVHSEAPVMPDSVTLCVDPDDDARRELLRRLSDRPGVTALAASSVEEARALLADTAVDCLITEHDLPDGTGVDLAEWIRQVSPRTWCLLYTDADRDSLDDWSADGVLTDYVAKGEPHALVVLERLARAAAESSGDRGYPVLPGDDDRVVVLEGLEVHASPLETALERLTTLAVTHFDVRNASINLIGDDTQEFAVQHAGAWQPMPRERSICTYSIVRPDGVTVVEDASTDPRFRDNDAPDDLDIRFYAGVTIAVDGLPVGTFCVYDGAPRQFDADDRNFLRSLGETAESLVAFYNRGH